MELTEPLERLLLAESEEVIENTVRRIEFFINNVSGFTHGQDWPMEATLSLFNNKVEEKGRLNALAQLLSWDEVSTNMMFIGVLLREMALEKIKYRQSAHYFSAHLEILQNTISEILILLEGYNRKKVSEEITRRELEEKLLKMMHTSQEKRKQTNPLGLFKSKMPFVDYDLGDRKVKVRESFVKTADYMSTGKSEPGFVPFRNLTFHQVFNNDTDIPDEVNFKSDEEEEEDHLKFYKSFEEKPDPGLLEAEKVLITLDDTLKKETIYSSTEESEDSEPEMEIEKEGTNEKKELEAEDSLDGLNLKDLNIGLESSFDDIDKEIKIAKEKLKRRFQSPERSVSRSQTNLEVNSLSRERSGSVRSLKEVFDNDYSARQRFQMEDKKHGISKTEKRKADDDFILRGRDGRSKSPEKKERKMPVSKTETPFKPVVKSLREDIKEKLGRNRAERVIAWGAPKPGGNPRRSSSKEKENKITPNEIMKGFSHVVGKRFA